MARTKRKALKKNAPLTWNELNKKLESSEEKYSIKGSFDLDTKILHPTFGIGFVRKVLDASKIEVLFEDKSRVLVQNIS